VPAGSRLPEWLPVYAVKAGADDTEGRFSMPEVVVTHDVPLHIHSSDDESFYMLEGELEVMFEGRTYTARPGDFTLLPHSVPDAIRRLSDEAPRLLQVSAPGGFESFAGAVAGAMSTGVPDLGAMQKIADTHGMTFLGDRACPGCPTL
jgi:mannose-6-phosphate isomerase-like protein (cupin superfamily)